MMVAAQMDKAIDIIEAYNVKSNAIRFLLIAALMAAHTVAAVRPALAQPAAAPPIAVDALRNAIYSGIYDAPITLTDGRYEGEPFVAGDPARPVVTYVDGAEVYGDLDGDAVDDAVVFLVENRAAAPGQLCLCRCAVEPRRRSPWTPARSGLEDRIAGARRPPSRTARWRWV
jgi:hypothetical protein